MILVDTSVWIKFFARKEPFASHLRSLLLREKVAGHELVYGELLIGDLGGRSQFLADYQAMFHARSVSHTDVVTFVVNRGFHGLGVSWIDVHLLASATVDGIKLWTADLRLSELATTLGFSYEPF